MQQQKFTLYYCYDAYCGWCYGNSAVMKKIVENFVDKIHVEVLSGGMVLPEHPKHISVTADYINQAYKRVEEYTGVKFGEDYLWHIQHANQSDWFPNSEMPSIALCILKEYMPNNQVTIATALQYALHYEGRDLTDKEAYRHLLTEWNIDADTFYQKLASETYKDKAHYEFALCKQLNVSSYPTCLLQVSNTKLYLLSNGYASYENLSERILRVMGEENAIYN
jgi:putative protein-disulfide isomerase